DRRAPTDKGGQIKRRNRARRWRDRPTLSQPHDVSVLIQNRPAATPLGPQQVEEQGRNAAIPNTGQDLSLIKAQCLTEGVAEADDALTGNRRSRGKSEVITVERCIEKRDREVRVPNVAP